MWAAGNRMQTRQNPLICYSNNLSSLADGIVLSGVSKTMSPCEDSLTMKTSLILCLVLIHGTDNAPNICYSSIFD